MHFLRPDIMQYAANQPISLNAPKKFFPCNPSSAIIMTTDDSTAYTVPRVGEVMLASIAESNSVFMDNISLENQW